MMEMFALQLWDIVPKLDMKDQEGALCAAYKNWSLQSYIPFSIDTENSLINFDTLYKNTQKKVSKEYYQHK